MGCKLYHVTTWPVQARSWAAQGLGQQFSVNSSCCWCTVKKQLNPTNNSRPDLRDLLTHFPAVIKSWALEPDCSPFPPGVLLVEAFYSVPAAASWLWSISISCEMLSLSSWIAPVSDVICPSVWVLSLRVGSVRGSLTVFCSVYI